MKTQIADPIAEQISLAFQKIQSGALSPDGLSADLRDQVHNTVKGLDSGQLRVAELQNGKVVVHQWIKEAILLYFRLQKMDWITAGDLKFFDKIPLKNWQKEDLVRIVPPAVARFGSFIEPGAILMPSYINIGARVGEGTMVDTWATVGSCAQIGKNVHLSGGVGIGGVLEPVQAAPVFVEDNCFIGSRCIVVEGLHLQKGVVLGAGVTLTASTKIIDVTGSEPQIFQGVVPENSVVIPGTQNKSFPAGEFGVPCALIIGKRKPSTDLKTSLTAALREFSVSV